MTRENFKKGLLITILGGFVLFSGIVYGTKKFAEGLYKDLGFFPVRLAAAPIDSDENFLSAKTGDIISIWLKVPDRKIENKDIVISGQVIDLKDQIVSFFEENFRYGLVRNSSGRGQYYRLSKLRFQNDFQGYLRYKVHGTWQAPYDGLVVVRMAQPFQLPFLPTGVVVIGCLFFLSGLLTMARNVEHTSAI